MNAIDNIRRDLQTTHWLEYSSEPFAGAVHNFARPLRERFEARQHVGPYYMQPATPGTGRGFYQHSKRLACGDGFFTLRLEEANDHLAGSRLSHINGYYCDNFQDQTLQPIVARLPHSRGFLAGWTMGRGMAASVAGELYATAEDAAYAAHSMAESDADREREYQAEQNAINDENEGE